MSIPPEISLDSRTPRYRVRFTNVTAHEAHGDRVKVTARRMAVETPWGQLDLTPEQVALVQGLYSTAGDTGSGNKLSDCIFSEDCEEEQCEAAALLTLLKLDPVSVEDVVSRWSNKWSQPSGRGAGRQERVLYQW